MYLSTVSRVLALVSSHSSAPSNAEREIEQVLATVSGAVERYMDRTVTAASVTEYLDVREGQTIFRLKAYPVTAVASVYFDDLQAFGAGTAIDSTYYFNPVYESAGMFRMRAPLLRFGVAPRSLKITYAGGMAADADAFIVAYPDISGAVDVQTSHEWQRRNALGVSSISYPDGTNASLSFDRWIPSVKQVLDYHRRVSV